MRRRWAVAAMLVAASSLGACGGGDDVADAASTESEVSDTAAGLDPGQMPAAGTVVVDLDGETFTFREAEATDFQCELSADRVEIVFESGDASVRAEYLEQSRVGGEAGVFAGTATVVPASFDRGAGETYTSAPGNVRVVLDPPHVMVSSDFTYSSASTDTTSDDVGTGTVTATCGDDGQPAGSGTADAAGPGTPDADGHAATITVGGETYDFGALADDVVCAATLGLYNGSATTEAKGGGTLGFEAVVFGSDSPGASAATDPPYVRLVDDGAGIDYVAGLVPGVDIDPGDGRVVATTVDGDTFTAEVEFHDTATGDLVPGTFTATCPIR